MNSEMKLIRRLTKRENEVLHWVSAGNVLGNLCNIGNQGRHGQIPHGKRGAEAGCMQRKTSDKSQC